MWEAIVSDQQLLKEIGDFCRDAGLAESTFGRLAINDDKLVSRAGQAGSGQPFSAGIRAKTPAPRIDCYELVEAQSQQFTNQQKSGLSACASLASGGRLED